MSNMKPKKIKSPVSGRAVKVPMIMQMEALECGAACLTMIMAYYDLWIPLEQVRVECGVSRDGSKASYILKAARKHGLKAQGYRREPEDLRKRGKFPCIIHWNFNHFVVLDGFRGNTAVLNDPARGTVRVSMEEFDESFTGICLEFEPEENFQPAGQQKSVLNFARKRLDGMRSAVIFVALATFISSLFAMMNPAFANIFTDQLLSGEHPRWVFPFLLLLTLVTIARIIAEWVNAIYTIRINGKMGVLGSSTFMWKVLHLPVEFFSQRMAGDIQQRQSSNAQVAQIFMQRLAPMALNTCMMIFYLILMIRYSVMMSLIGILIVLSNVLVTDIMAKKRVNLMRVQMRDQGKLAAAAVSGIEMIESIKATGAENGFFERWAGLQASVNAQQTKLARLSAVLGVLPQFILSLGNSLVMIFGVWMVIRGDFTAGMIQAFLGFMALFIQPAMQIISDGQMIQEMRTSMERIEDVMEYPSDEHYDIVSKEIEYSKLSGEIELRNVTFGYSRMDPPLFSELNMSIRPGSSVAIVGGSGSGKSTIGHLIAGLYSPWSGQILFDGRSIDSIDHSIMTGSMAVVDQDIILYEDTIENNIKMWDRSIEDFEVILAARDAQIHEDIMQRSLGYKTMLNEGGSNLSGGQRQRLEIARALVQDPSILLLDEATAALDARTEYNVIQNIRARGITTIIIAHRLSTIRSCDEIFVLDHGRIAEHGTHEELYAAGGMYTALVTNE